MVISNREDCVTPPQVDRQKWLVVAGALAFASVTYGIVLEVVSRSPVPEVPNAGDLGLVAMVGATICAAGSVLWTRLKVRRPVEAAAQGSVEGAMLPDPAAFQRASLVGMALAEAVAIFGFTYCIAGHLGAARFLPFGVPALLLIVLDGIPAGLAYWNAWDARAGSGGGDAPIG